MFRIAHLRHACSVAEQLEWRGCFNKRITGYANPAAVRIGVNTVEVPRCGSGADHVVVTGDITNPRWREFDEARALLDSPAQSVEVSVVPGNHDIYLPATHRGASHHWACFSRPIFRACDRFAYPDCFRA